MGKVELGLSLKEAENLEEVLTKFLRAEDVTNKDLTVLDIFVQELQAGMRYVRDGEAHKTIVARRKGAAK